MKRHTRPYGCTFPKCTKSFGSKNDWKRHETSRHYQHETWICGENTNGVSCTKVFFSADTARAHLTKGHKVTDPEAIERKIDTWRIGASCRARFWCGFCAKFIDLDQEDVDAWTKRFAHIDNHFMGKNGLTRQSINEWKAPDPERDNGQPKSSAKTGSPDDTGEDSLDSSSLSSSDTLSSAHANLVELMNAEAGPTMQKRRRASIDERGNRPPKRSSRGIYEVWIQCVRHTILLFSKCSFTKL